MKIQTRAITALLFYAAAYGGSLTVLSADPGFEGGDALAVMLIYGVGLSVAAWLATLRVTPLPVTVRRPAAEFTTVCIYLCLFALFFLGWGLSAIRTAVPAHPTQDVAILAGKILFMLVLPCWLLTRHGHHWRVLLAPRTPGRGGWIALVVIGTLLLVLQLTVGQGPQAISALSYATTVIVALTPFALAWQIIEAGLLEEFLFRVFFQTRAAALLHSETAGVLLMSLAFGLAHAPGYVLRGAHAMEGMTAAPTPLTAAAYAIVVVSPLGLMFGVLWLRTRNLWLLAALHGWGDLLPNLAPFVRTWAG